MSPKSLHSDGWLLDEQRENLRRETSLPFPIVRIARMFEHHGGCVRRRSVWLVNLIHVAYLPEQGVEARSSNLDKRPCAIVYSQGFVLHKRDALGQQYSLHCL